MSFYKSLIINGVEYLIAVNITGKGAPTTSTEAGVGMFYIDTLTEFVYLCTSVSGGVYTWKRFQGDADMSGYMVKPEATARSIVPYIANTGEQKTIPMSASPYAGYLATYGSNGPGSNNGVLSTNTPTADLHCANKKYVDDAIAASLGGGSGYTVTFNLYDPYGKGLAISKTAPLNNDDYDILLYGEDDVNYEVTEELKNVNRLYLWVVEEGGTELTVSKNGETLVTGNNGYNGNGEYGNVLNNVIQITEDCTLTASIDY